MIISTESELKELVNKHVVHWGACYSRWEPAYLEQTVIVEKDGSYYRFHYQQSTDGKLTPTFTKPIAATKMKKIPVSWMWVEDSSDDNPESA